MYPLDRIGGSSGKGWRRAGAGGENDQSGSQRPGIADAGCRVVGVQLHQPRDLQIRIAHERKEGKHLPGDTRHGPQPVMVAGHAGAAAAVMMTTEASSFSASTSTSTAGART